MGTLAFEPLNLACFAPLAPLLAFIAIRNLPPGAALRRMFAFGFVYYFGAIQWLTTIGQYAPLPILATVGIAALALYIAAYPALGVYALKRWAWPAGPGAQFVLFACVWLLAEWLRSLGRLAVPLAGLGHGWARWPVAIQIASVGGELAVGAIVLWLAGLLFYWGLFARTRKDPPSPGRPEIGRAIAPTILFPVWAMASLLFLTMWDRKLENIAADRTRPHLRAVVVQPKIEQEVKLASYSHPYGDVQDLLRDAMQTMQEQMLAGRPRPDWDAALLRLTATVPDAAYVAAFEQFRAAVAAEKQNIPLDPVPVGAELVVLPETAFSELDFPAQPEAVARAGAMARRAAAPILFGAGRIARKGETELDIYNSAFLAEASGAISPAVYDKIRLVPFGEDLPYVGWIPGMQAVTGIGSFSIGRGYTLFEVAAPRPDGRPAERPLRIGALICFESTFGASARRLVKEGADVLTVLTNDGWYGRSAGAAAHHNLSLLRAVETRRWLLRCANTGVSSIISPTGRIVATMPLGEAGMLRHTVAVKLDEGLTPFARFGNLWLIGPAGLLAAAFVRRRSRARAGS